jgi:flagellar hook assembly protein FlgD
MTRAAAAAVLFMCLVAAAATGRADTNVSGTISTNTTWTAANSPYVVTSTVSVTGTNPTLTIEAGVTVKFANGALLVIGYPNAGFLQAEGTASSPILFTSNGGTTAASWAGVVLLSASGSSMSYVTVEYAGSVADARGGVSLERDAAVAFDHVTLRHNAVAGLTLKTTSSATISNTTITDNDGPGVTSASSGAITVDSTSFTGNAGYAMSLDASRHLNGMTGLTASGNGGDAIELRSDTIFFDLTWHASALPYVITGGVNVSGTQPVLTIEAGTVVKLATGVELVIGYPSAGSLIAAGTAAAPILFTSTGATTPGSWGDIVLLSASGSTISYATIEYAGSTSQSRGGVSLERDAVVAFDHVTLRHNAVAGLTLKTTSSATISNSTITDNNGPGVTSASSGAITVDSTSFTGNAGYAMSLDASRHLNGMSGLTASGNGGDAIELRAATIVSDLTWHASALPYVITGGVNVSGTQPVLTIEAGTVVKFATGMELVIGYPSAGSLIAVGTAAAPILFTSTGATTPGSWGDIVLLSTSGSTISYATVEYAGSASQSRGGVSLERDAVVAFDHVTLRHNAVAGLTLKSTSRATLTDCTITDNAGTGINDLSPMPLSVASTAITNNNGFALSAAANVNLTGITNATMTGNTRNAIELRGATLSTSVLWPNFGVPYVLAGSLAIEGSNSSPAILTIPAGVTVRLASHVSIGTNWNGPGAIHADGTATDPILLTSDTSPSPGAWAYIALRSGAPSRFSYVTIEYGGGDNDGGVLSTGTSAPTFDHVTFRNNSTAALTVIGGAATFRDCSFMGAGNGIIAPTGASVDARNCYWAAADGPSGAGSGSGVPIGSTVQYDPWLADASSSPQYFSASQLLNRTFNPTLQTVATINLATPLSGAWTATILDAAGQAVKTFTGSGASGTVVWDAKTASNVTVADGRYMFELASVTAQNESAARVRGYVFVDSNKQFTASATMSRYFSPNGDGVQDTGINALTSNYDDASWVVTIRNAGGTVVRTLTVSGSSASAVWNGRDASAALLPDATYTVDTVATTGTASSSIATQVTTIDTVAPTATITSPTATGSLSNVHQDGTSDVPIVGVADDDATFDQWSIAFGPAAAPAAWTTVASSVIPVASGTVAVWPTRGVANGAYTLRLRVADKAGNTAAAVVVATLENFSVSNDAKYELNAIAGETIAYHSTVPYPVLQTVYIQNLAGQIVRTIFSGERVAGTYADTWDGKDDVGHYLPDGVYFYMSSATDGRGHMVWDVSADRLASFSFNWNDDIVMSAFDPFNNQPLTFTYSWPYPSVNYINLSPDPDRALGACSPPSFCILQGVYEESGPHTITWAGTDASGAYRPDIRRMGVVSFREQFAANAIVLHGTKSQLTNLHVTPALYGPATGTQTIAFHLTTFQNQAADVTVTLLNQASHSLLRTLTALNRPAGDIALTWDGRADNGMWVAPGAYTVTVTTTDPIGNVARAQILTTIQY